MGAPFYYTKHEGGAAYVYINSAEGFVSAPIKLTGKPESRFGFALANLGDINKVNVSSPTGLNLILIAFSGILGWL